MKSFIIVMFFLGMTTSLYAQEDGKVRNEGNMKTEELPEVVIKSAGADFSLYLPDKNPDKTVRRLQDKFIAYDLGKDYEGYESYLVTMELKNGLLAATYNENGKLTSVVENYQNVKLPREVIYSVYKTYPGWTIVKDKFLYSQEDGDIKKKEYSLKIKKDKEVRELIVNPKGEILKGYR